MLAIPLQKVLQIIDLNKKNKMPEQLEDFAEISERKTGLESVVGNDDLTRFDD